jgi:hypothetical protein
MLNVKSALLLSVLLAKLHLLFLKTVLLVKRLAKPLLMLPTVNPPRFTLMLFKVNLIFTSAMLVTPNSSLTLLVLAKSAQLDVFSVKKPASAPSVPQEPSGMLIIPGAQDVLTLPAEFVLLKPNVLSVNKACSLIQSPRLEVALSAISLVLNVLMVPRPVALLAKVLVS